MTPKHDWSGKTCVILASGPGLTKGQVDHTGFATLRDDVVAIAVNSTFKIAHWAEVIYAGDLQWWKMHHKAAARTGATLWTGDNQAANHYRINRLKCVNRPGLGLQYTHAGGNSGYQAVNLAFLWGCRRILLLGFTMREIDGRKHWHPDHPAPLVQQILPDEWRHKFAKLALDLKAQNCEVINCDPLSALTCFPRGDIEEELK